MVGTRSPGPTRHLRVSAPIGGRSGGCVRPQFAGSSCDRGPALIWPVSPAGGRPVPALSSGVQYRLRRVQGPGIAASALKCTRLDPGRGQNSTVRLVPNSTLDSLGSRVCGHQCRRSQPRIHQQLDDRAQGSGSRPQATRYVHRFDVGAGPAPPGVGGRRQLGRRSPGRVLRPDRGHPAGRRRGPRRRQRPRDPGRRQQGTRHDGHRGRADDPARRRQVRQRFVRGVGRAARRRGVGGERAVVQARRRGRPRRVQLDAALRQSEGGGARPQGGEDEPPRHDDHVLGRRHDLRNDHLLVRDDQPPAAGNGVPEPGPHDRAAR